MVACLVGFFEVFGLVCELFKIGIDWQLILSMGMLLVRVVSTA
jgi:hypothetical protein